MKLYDFDGMFDEKLAEYIKKNGDKYRESEWEDVIPKMYARFGDTTIKSLGKSPNAYYGSMDGETLVATLRAHLKQGVPVSEFLCGAIEKRHIESLLVPLLSGTEDEIAIALNLIGANECAIDEYFRLLTESDDEDVRNTCVDHIKEFADNVKDRALKLYEQGVRREYMLEILSRCVLRDDRIFEILIKEFRTDCDNLPMHASYLAAYGDERALPYLLDKIDEEGINYIEFQELKYAIESLGGSYEKERDFSNDEYYRAIKAHSADGVDLFTALGDKK